MKRSIHNENHAKKRAKKGGEKSEKCLYLLGFCPNGKRNASDESGKNTAYALLRGHVIEIAKNHVPDIAILCSNCREECKKQKGNCRYCKPLSAEEINAKVAELVGEFGRGDVAISLGGGESNHVVSQVALTLDLDKAQWFASGNHASTHVVSYATWTSTEAQVAASIKSAKAMSNAMCLAGLSPDQDCLFNALAGDSKVAFVQHGLDAQVSSSILVLSFCHTSHDAVSLDRPCAGP
jgi:hypothetical protein